MGVVAQTLGAPPFAEEGSGPAGASSPGGGSSTAASAGRPSPAVAPRPGAPNAGASALLLALLAAGGFGPLVGRVPKFLFSALLLHTAAGLLRDRLARPLRTLGPAEAAVVAAIVAATAATTTAAALGLGTGCSLLLFVHQVLRSAACLKRSTFMPGQAAPPLSSSFLSAILLLVR